MPDRPVGFYVHHHGGGHANRCKLLARRYHPRLVSVFTSAPERFAGWTGGRVIPLPPDVSPQRDPAGDLLTDRVLHYAPVDLPDLSRRMAILADYIAEAQPERFIVDLSVEVALFARLCGARVDLVRLHGHRNDPAHTAAFQLADRLLAPFAPELEDAHTPQWVRDKTDYLGNFSRYDDRRETRAAARRGRGWGDDERVVTVINGSGGGERDTNYWIACARALPEWQWHLVGKLEPTEDAPGNFHVAGFVDDTFPYLKGADVVIGSGGTNTMMEILAAGVPYLSLPEPRPFDEQVCKMRALERLGKTRVIETLPEPPAWRAYFSDVRARR